MVREVKSDDGPLAASGTQPCDLRRPLRLGVKPVDYNGDCCRASAQRQGQLPGDLSPQASYFFCYSFI